MLDEKKLKQVESRVKQYLSEGTIKTKQQKEFVDFFKSYLLSWLSSRLYK